MRMAGHCLGMLWVLASAVAGAQAEERVVSLVTCPIARDAGPDADVCFVAAAGDGLIALVNPPDFGNPQLHHRVLVEGVITGEPGMCGARKFEGRISVLAELAPECNVILPYDGSFEGIAGGVFNNGSAEQKAHAQALAARIPTEPGASLEPAILDPPPTPAPTPPFAPRELIIIYPFDSTRGSGPDMIKLRDLVEFSRVSAARVEITGYRADSRLDDGSTLHEQPTLARRRAQAIAGIMTRLGLDVHRTIVRSHDEASAGTGHDDWRNRRVAVEATPTRSH